ncbi:MAG: malate synthase G, partial [Sphingobium sp.]
MTDMIDRAGLQVARQLATFIEERALPGTGVDAAAFWSGVATVFARFVPENRALLEKRDLLQARIDAWYRERPGQPPETSSLRDFLHGIGYLVPEPAPFAVTSENVDDEIARLAGPQLVVPILNARFLLNAANARWGSLYDALYGTDAIPGAPAGKGYDAARGAQVIAWSKAFLDRAVPLANGSWSDLANDDIALADPAQYVGHSEKGRLFRHNGLHIEIVFDRAHPIGRDDPAGIADVILESALTTICDLEDSVAAVDAEDKVAAYTNWLGLMQGDLTDTFEKNGAMMTRALNPDRAYTAPDGGTFTLPGRSLLLVRNVGHLMTTPAILLPDGSEAPEGILDGIVTSLIAMHDL